ncbi:permease [Cyanobacterium sp. IPPAS B-1200]|uniref:permease n=1 Tax=Cyanobacterium sp. IPPAS B-1200 TaxID=1562720 RepID=UPI000852651E|nr:permease [Cyanobacterium sp. IPPAS B-1200]OEJ79031.1 permease [Cyanobacterium sp. IPPAS B-1200]
MDHQIYSALTLFISLLVEAMPFLLFGVLLSSSLIVFLDEGKLIEMLPSNPILGAFIGSFFGFCFPVCECGNVPVARRFLLQGLPTSVAISFLLAAPTINPVVLWSTYVAFRGQPEVFWLRIIFSLTIAMTLGCLFSLQKDCRPLLKPSLAKRLTVLLDAKAQAKSKPVNNLSNSYSLLQSGSFILGQPGQVIKMDDALLKAEEEKQKKEALGRKFNLFIENVTQELRDLGGVLILGSAIASTIQVFIPREIILNIGQDTVTSIIAMMVLASVVSICSTVDSFFVLSFSSTFTTASLVAFLVFGPMIDIKAMGLMLSIFKPRMIFYLMVIIAQFTFIFTLSYSYFF